MGMCISLDNNWYEYNEKEVSWEKKNRLNEIEELQIKLEKQKEILEAFQVLFEKSCG